MNRWTDQIANNVGIDQLCSANPSPTNITPLFSFRPLGIPWYPLVITWVPTRGIALPLHLVFGRAGATQEAAAQDPAGGEDGRTLGKRLRT